MQVTEFIFDPAANYVKLFMIVIGRIMHTAVNHVTVMIMTAIMQALFRIVLSYFMIMGLRITLIVHTFAPVILAVPRMMIYRILTDIHLALGKMHVIGSARIESAEADFVCGPAADHVVLYLLAVPKYLIATMRMITRVCHFLS